MASVPDECARLLASKTQTPIAQLNPDLADQTSRTVRGEVTITWPYNGVKNTFAFLLAEPDVRLRRAKGQVRIELHGAAAKTVADSGLGGGDEVILSLDGVVWAKDESTGRIPGARVDWQLQFTDRLTLQAKSGESSELKSIRVDRAQPDAPIAPVAEPQPPAVEPEVPISPKAPDIRRVADPALDEYPSPAFIKRARLSYGALFEGGFDIFEEDGGVKGKGRKRTRFGRGSSAWRYTSQSPSPEPASTVQDVMEDSIEETRPAPRSGPQMMDDSSRAIGPLETLPAAEPAPGNEIDSPPRDPSAVLINPFAKPAYFVEQHEPPSNLSSASIVAKSSNDYATASDSPPLAAFEKTPSTLFGAPKQPNPAFSMFGTTTPIRGESGLNFADQVRFEFSHIPQTPQPPGRPHAQLFEGPGHQQSSEYPETYLDTPGPAKYADMSYPDITGDHEVTTEPPVMEEFPHGQWDMVSQSPHYNEVEVGHFGVDALNEGHRITAGNAKLHSEAISEERVPKGFSSYGSYLGATGVEPESEGRHSPHLSRPEEERLDKDDDTHGPSGEENEVEGEEGEKLEEGDYDQRNYNIPSDDDEGLSDENEDIEEEAEDGYDEEDIYGEDEEDGYGEDWEEGDDESDDESGHWQGPPAQPQRTPAAPASGPVFISLLSDSEDDDESAPAPAKPPGPPNTNQKISVPPQSSPSIEHEDLPRDGDLVPPSGETASSLEPSNEVSMNTSSPIRIKAVDSAMPSRKISQQKSDGGTIGAVGSGSSDEESAIEDRGVSTHDLEVGQDSEPSSVQDFGEPSDDDSDSGNESSENGILAERQDVDSDQEQEGEYPSESSEDEEMDQSPVSRSKSHPKDISKDGFEDEVEGEESMPGDIEGNSTQDHDSGSTEVDIARQVTDTHIQDPREQKEKCAADDVKSSSSLERQLKPQQAKQEDVNMGDEDVEMIDSAPSVLGTDVEKGHLLQSLEPEVPEAVEERPGQSMTQPSPTGSRFPGSDTTPVTADTTAIGYAPVLGSQSHGSASNTTAIPDPGISTYKVNGFGMPPSSPPLTQSFESHTAKNQMPPLFSPAASRPTSKEGASLRQLLTPMESQLTVDMVSDGALVEEYETSEVHTPVTAEKQRRPSHSLIGVETNFGSLSHPELGDVNEPTTDHSAPAAETAPIKSQITEELAEDIEDARSPSKLFDTTMYRQADDSVLSIPQANPDGDESHADDDTTVLSVRATLDTATAGEVSEQASPRVQTRSAKKRRRAADEEVIEDNTTAHTRQTRSHDSKVLQMQADQSPPGPSISLARHAVAAKRPKKVPEPLRTSPMITRARSSSLQMSATPEGEEDKSIYLARASLASPSKARTSLDSSTTSLKSEITKRLRSHRECVSLKSLRSHLDKHPNVMAVVTTQPLPAVRAKGGPREFMLSFNVTDTSTAPSQVIEVQFYRPHKESLPVVKPGDVILLQGFQVKALSNRGFGLRSHSESAWAVFDVDNSPPQIKGPPVEDWEQYEECAGLLRTWYQSMDEATKGKLEKANRKLEST